MAVSTAATTTNRTKKKPRPPKEYIKSTPSFRHTYLANPQDVERLRKLTAPHVESFDYFLESIPSRLELEAAELDIVDPKSINDETVQISWEDVAKVEFWFQDVQMGQPLQPTPTAKGGAIQKLLPRECRERKLHYTAPLSAMFCWRTIQRRNGVAIPGKTQSISRVSLGDFPIMVGSRACHLHRMTPAQLVKLREEVSQDGMMISFHRSRF